MKTAWMLTLLIALSTFWGAANAYENPLKNAKVGDWIEYKRTMTMPGGKSMDQTIKQTVTAKDEKEITERIEMTMMGKTMPGTEIKIPLDAPYNPVPTGHDPKTKVEIVGQGDEEIKVGEKTYACHWVEMKATSEVRGENSEIHSKSWICKDVPLSGAVKVEFDTSKGIKMNMEMTGSGTGAK